MDVQWDSLTPFSPLVAKNYQAVVALVLMAIGLSLTGLFSLNKSPAMAPLLALPASLSFALGAVSLMCAVGVYV